MRISSVRTNRSISNLYPLEISSEKDEVINASTINNEADDQQCTDDQRYTDDIGEHLPSMKKQPIRSSAAKARQNKHIMVEQRDFRPCPRGC